MKNGGKMNITNNNEKHDKIIQYFPHIFLYFVIFAQIHNNNAYEVTNHNIRR
jgi:hypothetical protein